MIALSMAKGGGVIDLIEKAGGVHSAGQRMEQQKYNLDLTLNFTHDYDVKTKGASAPPTNGSSRFEMRRVERIEHLTFAQCGQLMTRINALIDELEKESTAAWAATGPESRGV